jgi:hypothetical protein
MPEYLPSIRGLVPARVEAEIHRAFKALYEYVDNELAKIERTATTINSDEIKRQLQLFAGGLAIPLTDPVGDNLATAGVETTLTPADIPSLDTAKITSGRFPLTRIPTNVLKTDDTLTKIIAAAPYANDGYITIKDNSGADIKIMTTIG